MNFNGGGLVAPFRYHFFAHRPKPLGCAADQLNMLLPFRPMTNYERQLRFRERNPGYYARLKARGRKTAEEVRLVWTQALEAAQGAEVAAPPLEEQTAAA